MAHGLAIRAFIFAYQLIEDEKYLNAAKSLLNSFFVEVVDGGVTHKDSDSSWWYEEYASK
jgi:heparosan-N-sulfate-glucuronate 5-epimerase